MASYDRLSALDNTFLDLEKHNTHMHVAATVAFRTGPLATEQGGVDIDRIRRYIASRLHLIPRYRQKLARIPIVDHPVWIDDEHFNITYHVRHTCLPAPGTAGQLKALAGRIMSQQLDRAKPLWEFWVVEGLSGGEEFAVIQKAHHCMIDGISGVDLMAVLMSPSADDSFEPRSTWLPRPAPSRLDLARGELWRRAREPFDVVADLRAAGMHPAQALTRVREGIGAVVETLAAGGAGTPELPFNRRIGPHRRFDWLAMNLADVKRVKDRLGGTVNDVVLATVAGAVHLFLIERGFSRNGNEIRAGVPVSIRHDDEHGTLGNRIAMWLAELPVGESDPERRLRAIRATTDRLRRSKQALGAAVLASVSELTSSTLLSLSVRLAARARPYNLVVTNVPGPQMPLYMLGAPLTEIYPMVNLLENQGIGIALFSYDGKLFWGVLGDWELMPDLDRLVDAIRRSFGELGAAAEAVRP